MRLKHILVLATAGTALAAASPATARESSFFAKLSNVSRAYSYKPAVGGESGLFVNQLVNFSHVYNYKPSSGGVNPNVRGTDIEFYTADVPKRNYSTGQLLNAAGQPLLPGEPTVIVTRDFAVMGSYSGGAWVFDITNPAAPQFVKNIPCSQEQNDVQIKKFGSRWFLALARDLNSNTCVTSPSFRFPSTTAGAGIAVFDISDPYVIKKLYQVKVNGGAHNFTFHPTKPFGVVSTGDLPGGPNHIPVIDFTTPDTPTLAVDLDTVGGPHDIAFTPDGNRMFVANENHGRIYDTTNPAAPVLRGMTPNVGSYLHGFDPARNGKIAVGTNESLVLGGFFTPQGVCPGEGLTFYNVEGAQEQAPVPVGHFLAPVQGPSSFACTGHIPVIAPNSRVLVVSWYGAGTRVVNFANPAQPVELGSAIMDDAIGHSEAWSSKFYKGPYVYVSDEKRGFDVFKWTGALPAPWEAP